MQDAKEMQVCIISDTGRHIVTAAAVNRFIVKALPGSAVRSFLTTDIY